MRTQNRTGFGKAVSIASGAVLLAASATSAFGQAAYQYIDVGAAFSAVTEARAINDAGQIVGVVGANLSGVVREAGSSAPRGRRAPARPAPSC